MSLPFWGLAALVMGASLVICVGGHQFARWVLPKRAKEGEDATELATAIMQVVAAFIGIMLAFAAVEVWQDYQTADDAVAHEAAATAELYRDLTTYGPETIPARAKVRAYVNSVLHDEWPNLTHGAASPKTAAALAEIFREFGRIEPETNRQTAIYAEAFGKLNEVVGLRRERLITSRSELPPMFWGVILMGTMVMVGYTFVFKPTIPNSIIIAGLSVSLGLIFLFILSVERPYAGQFSVDSEEIRGLLELFDSLAKLETPPTS
ncbi:DUF4239 domain-containing protein [Phenylobacterium sp. J367]|uniref:bestrophin-like domain n=1 Tax=Phenylobacterium sp. J367 TaxID=2898435 RepID=UPI002150D294|nr:DUF4239 domain-containing protein [Phenylobacterium sp. J367]MCR5877239.1 DUF4239 domain-containing protein [Phenylobacterium sp. J367]